MDETDVTFALFLAKLFLLAAVAEAILGGGLFYTYCVLFLNNGVVASFYGILF